MTTSNRSIRKVVLCCALVVLGLARTAEAEETGCCLAAVSACDGACGPPPREQYSCSEGFEYYHCVCSDATVEFVPKSVCAPS
jgi:hypothetical protein